MNLKPPAPVVDVSKDSHAAAATDADGASIHEPHRSSSFTDRDVSQVSLQMSPRTLDVDVAAFNSITATAAASPLRKSAIREGEEADAAAQQQQDDDARLRQQHYAELGKSDTLESLQASHNFGGLPAPSPGEPFILGICCMEKKASSKPMQQILKRVTAKGACTIVNFSNDVLANAPIEEWPRCHALIAFFSDGFPLEKAEAYAALYRPFLVNELQAQHLLMDRRHVYRIMGEVGVPVPHHVVMNRGSFSPSGVAVNVQAEGDLVEHDDYIEVNGVRLNKPFVEKPIDGEDHNVYIYYPRSSGGGHKRLFRKVGDRASEFYPDITNVRRDGSFIYEEFLATEGTDVKVYAVTGEYCHAEARKSPVVDGKVMRDSAGHEIRYPIMLSNYEKELGLRITAAFGQRVCGFDMLRSNGRSYVCDVNGWSFVKKSVKYYDDAALLLVRLIKRALGLHTPSNKMLSSSGAVGLLRREYRDRDRPVPSDTEDNDSNESPTEEDADSNDESNGEESFEDETTGGSGVGRRRGGGGVGSDNAVHEELRCVVAVVRHGDRTPKQKLKMNITSPLFLALFDKYSDPNKPKNEVKLKSAVQLSDALETTRQLLERAKSEGFSEDDSETEFGSVEKLSQMRTVLEMHGRFKGVNRKVQLKAVAFKSIPKNADPDLWRNSRRRGGSIGTAMTSLLNANGRRPSSSGGGGAAALAAAALGLAPDEVTGEIEMRDIVMEVQLILKWGGVLTQSGRDQAEQMGRSFRMKMYPGKDGLIRLHSTYRHDLKIYSSDEGRVQVTAAAFTKGLLDLEGHLTPILASLVRKSPSINKVLDDASAAHKQMQHMKEHLKTVMNAGSVLHAESQAKLQSPISESAKAKAKAKAAKAKSKAKTKVVEEVPPPSWAKHMSHCAPTQAESLLSSLEEMGNPRQQMELLRGHVRGLAQQLRMWLKRARMLKAQSVNGESYLDGPLGESNSTLDGGDVINNADIMSGTVAASAELLTSELGINTGGAAGTSSSGEGGSAAYSMGLKGSVQQGDSTPILQNLDKLQLGYARWQKLDREFYSLKKKVFDISKIPDIYDCAKFDILHNPEMLNTGADQPNHLLNVYLTTKPLADFVVPQEYGVTRKEKVTIATRVAAPLLHKIMTDLQTSARSSDPSGSSGSPTKGKGSGGGPETVHRLDKRYAKSMGIKSTERHVRTRLYFTSESHLHSLLNALRYTGEEANDEAAIKRMKKGGGGEDDEEEGISLEKLLPTLSREASKRIGELPELGYMTHIVFRLFELKTGRQQRHDSNSRRGSKHVAFVQPPLDPARFRLSISLSNGVPSSMNEPSSKDLELASIPVNGLLSAGELPAVVPPAVQEEAVSVAAPSLEEITASAASSVADTVKDAASVVSDAVHVVSDAAVAGASAGASAVVSAANMVSEALSPSEEAPQVQLEPALPLVPLWPDLEMGSLVRLLECALEGSVGKGSSSGSGSDTQQSGMSSSGNGMGKEEAKDESEADKVEKPEQQHSIRKHTSTSSGYDAPALGRQMSTHLMSFKDMHMKG